MSKYVSENYLMLSDNLKAIEEKYKGSNAILGSSSLGYPGYSSANRNTMFNGHLKQYVTLKNPDIPGVFTNNENLFGKLSSGYKELKHRYRVIKKVSRYSYKPDHLYKLFVYNIDEDRFEVIDKKNVENLTEKYAFEYNTERIDSLKEGDELEAGEVLFKSTSYDQHMNYRMGKNISVCFSIDNDTIEDAMVASESLAEELKSTEMDTVEVSLNDNDILLNLYGDSEHYQPLPMIGEYTNGHVVCCKRRIYNNQILFDLKESNLKKINFTSANDTPFYGEGFVEDINIYCNKQIEDIPNNNFNEVFISLLKEQERYWREIEDVTTMMLESDSKCHKDISYYNKRAKNTLDPDIYYREEDSIFSNMKIEIIMRSEKGIWDGSKLTGRVGNKGVVSKILPDDEMPYCITEYGNIKRADLIVNVLGVPNRTNPFQNYDQEINYGMFRISEILAFDKKLSTKEKEELFFKFYNIFNTDQEKSLREFFENTLETKERKEVFFKNLFDKGMKVHIPSFWTQDNLFNLVHKMYKEFPFLNNIPKAYRRVFNRDVELMNPVIIADMYMFKLKQDSGKGHSARALGAIDSSCRPAKTSNQRNHKKLHKDTPIRIGNQELFNLAFTASEFDIAELFEFYRSNPVARRWLANQLMEPELLEEFDKMTEGFNINAQILNAYLKSRGLKLEFPSDYMVIKSPGGEISTYQDEYGMVIGTDMEKDMHKAESYVKRKYENDVFFIGTEKEYDELIKKETEELYNELV